MTKYRKLSPKAQCARRREEVGDMYLQGRSRAYIARKMKLGLSTVSRYLAQLRREWAKETKSQQMMMLTQELTRLQRLEIAAWDAWERSHRDLVVNKLSVDGQESTGKQRAEQTTRSQFGNPQFLQVIAQSIIRRCQLMGLDRLMQDKSNQHLQTPFVQLGSSNGMSLDEIDEIDRLRELACQADLVSSSVCESGEPGPVEDGGPPEDSGSGLE